MKHSFEIKICGINDQISMNAAITNGVNYIGLVFFKKSPDLTVPPVTKILLFIFYIIFLKKVSLKYLKNSFDFLYTNLLF